MKLAQLKYFTRTILESHKRIIKPWKKRKLLNDPYLNDCISFEECYALGWNDCLKEIEKNHKEFMVYSKREYDL